jgi:hypothetical protein
VESQTNSRRSGVPALARRKADPEKNSAYARKHQAAQVDAQGGGKNREADDGKATLVFSVTRRLNNRCEVCEQGVENVNRQNLPTAFLLIAAILQLP